MRSKRGVAGFIAFGVVTFVLVACGAERDDGSGATEHVGESRERLTVTASADTTIRGGSPNTAAGSATSLELRQQGPRRVLIRFSDSDVQSFASGDSVSLNLTIASIGDNWDGGRYVSLFRLNHDWDEAHATWACSFDANPANGSADCSGATAWSMGTAPLPYVTTPTAKALLTNHSSGVVSLSVGDDIALFNSGTANYGWLLRDEDETQAGAVDFASRETSTPPTLTSTGSDGGTDASSDTGGGGGGDGAADSSAGPGKLHTITDARGRVTTISIDASGDLVSLAKPDLETWLFTYENHRMTAKQSPKQDTTSYTFRADGTVATLTKPEGATTTIDAVLSHPATYDEATGALVRGSTYTDARGVVHAFQVNPRGAVELDSYVADGVARVERPVYVDASHIADSDPIFGLDVLATARNNALFRVAYRTLDDIPMSARRDLWDAHYRPLRAFSTSFGTSTHDFRYTSDGWLRAERVGSAAFAQVYDRDAAGHVTRVYDSSGNIVNGSLPVDGQVMTYTYRADGQVQTSAWTGDGVRNLVKTFHYDDVGGTLNNLGWTDSLGRSTALTLDAAGNVVQTFDGTATTHASFDAMNRLVTSSDALGNTTSYGYAFASCGCSQENLVTSIHTPDVPDGIDWLMNYDGQGRLASVTDPDGFTESYSYEPTGELKTLTDKLTRQTSYSHDQLGRVLAMVDTLGRKHSSVYAVPTTGAWSGPTLMAGSADATSATTDLNGALRAGDYQIGQNGYPVEGYPAVVSLYQDATFQLGYSRTFDVNRRMLSRFDRAGAAFDSTSFVLGGGFWSSQDAWNVNTARPVPSLVSSLKSGGGSESGSFVQNVFFEDTSDAGFNAGADGFEQQTYTRDDGGRVTALRHRITAPGAGLPQIDLTSSYTYRADGRLGRLVNPDGTHDFTYDARGLMATQVVSGDGTYTYGFDEMSRPSSLTYPDGHVRTQQYDDLGRLSSRCYDYTAVGGTVRCYTASYDAVGNPVRMTDPDGVDVFVYDGLDRLTEDKRYLPDGTTLVSDELYTYNALGALKTNANVVLDDQRPKLAGGGTADAAVPATLNGQPVDLNAGGFVTSMNGTSFSWSERGFLRQAQDPVPAAPEQYTVDAQLRRIAKTQSGTSEFYYFEGMDRVAVLDALSAPKETYLFDGVDHPLRVTQSATSTTAYYELDLAGNVRHLFASGGTDLGGYRYSAFGKTEEDTTTITQPLRWKGRWFSSVAGGIYDVRARQWAPEMGVFLTVDGFEHYGPNQSLWAWPHQSPTKYLDPRGEQGVLAGAAGAAEAGAAAYVIVSGGYCGIRWADCQYKEANNPQRPPIKEPGCPPKNGDIPPITVTPTNQKPSCDACFLKCVGRFYLAFLKIDPWPAECNR